jgi:hypothetical protein
MSAEKPKTTARQAIIVLGMHRTGTSAVGGVLVKLGVQEPRTLMPPTQDNPKGYWESTAIMKFNDRILDSAGTRWSDWDRFNAEWINSPLREAFVDELSSILEEEYGNAPLILIKDPRMCRLFPLWATVLEALGVTPKIVITVRHPAEVIRSLEKRDQLTQNQSKLIWLRHMLDAEHSTRGLQRVFIRYSDILRNWQFETDKVSSQLDVKWPRVSGATTAEIDAYLASELRHHVVTESVLAQNPGIASWVAAAYRAIESLADGAASPGALEDLDRIREEFNRTSLIYAPVVHEQRNQLESRISDLNRDIAALSKELESTKHAHHALEQENIANYKLYDDSRSALEEMEKRGQLHEAATMAMISKYEIELAELATQTQARETELDAKLDRAEKKRSELESSHRAEIARMDAGLRTQVRRLKDDVRVAQESLQERSAESAKLTEWVLDLERKLEEKETTIRSERDNSKRVISECNERIRILEAAGREGASRNQALAQELDAQASLLAEHHTESEKLHSSRYWRLASSLRRLTGRGAASAGGVEPAQSDMDVLRRSALFDRDWYLSHYPDVRSRKMDPVGHYLKYGAKEGRDPCAAFSTVGYLSRYPDVGALGINPLVHYIKHGRKEGRVISKKDVESR